MVMSGKNKRSMQKIKIKIIVRGRAGIEPATSPTRTENHTSRPTALVPVKVASSEDRTRDLALTKRMLCQLSYRGDARVRARVEKAGVKVKSKKNKLRLSDQFNFRNSPDTRTRQEYLVIYYVITFPVIGQEQVSKSFDERIVTISRHLMFLLFTVNNTNNLIPIVFNLSSYPIMSFLFRTIHQPHLLLSP